MKVIDKIDIPRIDLENQKITDFTELSLEIRDNSVCFIVRFYADEPIDTNDKSLGWENVLNCFKVVASKQNIAGIEKSWVNTAKKWGIYILIDGFTNDIKFYFKRESEAESIFTKLHAWLYE